VRRVSLAGRTVTFTGHYTYMGAYTRVYGGRFINSLPCRFQRAHDVTKRAKAGWPRGWLGVPTIYYLIVGPPFP